LLLLVDSPFIRFDLLKRLRIRDTCVQDTQHR